MENFQPSVIVLAGLSFSGKTTLGRELAKESNLVMLDVDEARQEITSGSPEHVPGQRLDPEGEKQIMEKSYIRNHEKARELIGYGKPVILSATYSRELYHEMLKKLVDELHVPLRVFYLETPESEVHKRIVDRKPGSTNSNVFSIEPYLEQKSRYRLIEGVDLTRIDTSKPIQENMQEVMSKLSDLRI